MSTSSVVSCAGAEPAALGGWAARWRLLAKDTAIYGFSGALARMGSLLTFPILTRGLTPENYGRVDLLLVAASLGAMVLIMGQDSAVARLYYDERPSEEKSRIITQAFLIQASAVFLVGGVALAYVFSQPAATPEARDFKMASLLQLANLPLIVVAGFAGNILRWTFRRREYIVISLGGAALVAFGMLGGLVLGGRTVAGVFAGLLAGNVVVAGAAIWFVRGWLHWPPGRAHVRELLRLGWAYMGIAVLGAWMATLERALIHGLGTETMLGQYAAGARVASIMLLPIGAFQAAWAPMSLAIHQRPNAADTYGRVLLLSSLGLVGLAVGASLVAEPAVRLLAGSDYVVGAVVVGPLMLGLAARALGWVGGIGLDLAKKPQWVIPAQVCGSLATINVATFWPSGDLAQRVAWAACIGQIASAVLVCYFGHRCRPQAIGYLWPTAVTAAGLAAIAFCPSL